MKSLTRREFGKTVASGIGAISACKKGAAFIQQTTSISSPDQKREYSLENKFGISLAVNTEEGFYTIRYGGERWLGKGIASVLENKRWYRSAELKDPSASATVPPEGRLLLAEIKTGRSSDSLGNYNFIELEWKVPNSARDLVTGFRLYSDRSCLVLVQKFPHGFKDYASGN